VAATEIDSATAVEVRTSGAGMVTRPGEPEALLEAVTELGTDPERCRAFGKCGTTYAEEHLSAVAGIEAFEQLLARVVSRTNGAQRAAAPTPLPIAN
jgi:hypothetical protein